MDRRRFLLTSLAGALAVPLAVEAQQASKASKKLGILSLVADSPGVIEAFLQGMKGLGWVEGQNVAIERRSAEGHDERLASLAAELVRLHVDVILAAGGPATLDAARHATKIIPIVMVASSRDPIGDDLIQSYAKPGGNITGIVTAPDEVTGKQSTY